MRDYISQILIFDAKLRSPLFALLRLAILAKLKWKINRSLKPQGLTNLLGSVHEGWIPSSVRPAACFLLDAEACFLVAAEWVAVDASSSARLEEDAAPLPAESAFEQTPSDSAKPEALSSESSLMASQLTLARRLLAGYSALKIIYNCEYFWLRQRTFFVHVHLHIDRLRVVLVFFWYCLLYFFRHTLDVNNAAVSPFKKNLINRYKLNFYWARCWLRQPV